MRILDERNIEDIALGAAVLGTGGGGDPYIGMLMARRAIRDYGPVELYSLDELDDDVNLAQLGPKLTLLLPPFDKDSDEYDYVELHGDEPLDEDFDE